ncbi:selenide, water dikinase SelD [Fuerstiella marisgermanici]|nr:selenide, water dikinase SelD [Fuerstiella marisgermanici]
MQIEQRLASRHLVLLGIGHTNAHIVRQWGMNPIADVDLTCISDRSVATYSGMLPAALAGQIPTRDMEIDLVRLCASVNARLIIGTVTGLDSNRQVLHFADRPSVPFDVLSVGIGSVPTDDGVHIEGDSLIRIKPMQTFLQRLDVTVNKALKRRTSMEVTPRSGEHNAGQTSPAPLKIVVVGSGAAGTEITFCLPGFIQSKTDVPFELQIVTRSDAILPGVTSGLRDRAAAELKRRGVAVHRNATITHVDDTAVTLQDGQKIVADIVIWATGASPPELLSQLNLPLTGSGFLATEANLRSTSGAPIFAVGDTGSIVSEKVPKAGVYAVRQGPVLWDNIKALLAAKPLSNYEPQSSFLKLLNTGDGKAIGEWKGFSFGGRFAMKLKHYIDSKFMKMYQVSGSMKADTDMMQCKGCGCKLGSQTLNTALRSSFALNEAASASEITTAADQQSNIDQAIPADDAAVITTDGGRIIATTDFFTNPVNDAFLFGRIAALHSASDIVAMGATATAALANVVLPEGDTAAQQTALHDFLAGARHEFAQMNADIVGGHTIVGPRWEAGFTVIGNPPATPLLQKGSLQIGDMLYLTKPLGIGVLLAAHMRSQCAARDYESLIAAMLQPQHMLAKLATDCGITAATDVTGFGLAGHLVEMLQASHQSATLNLKDLQLLPGAAAAFDAGIESTLAPNNRAVEQHLTAAADVQSRPEYRALFDPQTCGGLLLGVPKPLVQKFETAMVEADLTTAIAIGEVVNKQPNSVLIQTT